MAMNYNFLVEGQFGGANWRNLAAAILENLNTLELNLGMEKTTLRLFDPGAQVATWVTANDWTFQERIDQVRAAISLTAFEWPPGFDLLNQSRFYSATDINTIARAVGHSCDRVQFVRDRYGNYYPATRSLLRQGRSVDVAFNPSARTLKYKTSGTVYPITETLVETGAFYELDNPPALLGVPDNNTNLEIMPWNYIADDSVSVLRCWESAFLECGFWRSNKSGLLVDRNGLTRRQVNGYWRRTGSVDAFYGGTYQSWRIDRVENLASAVTDHQAGYLPDPETYPASGILGEPNHFAGFTALARDIDGSEVADTTYLSPAWAGWEKFRYSVANSLIVYDELLPQLAALTITKNNKSLAWTMVANLLDRSGYAPIGEDGIQRLEISAAKTGLIIDDPGTGIVQQNPVTLNTIAYGDPGSVHAIASTLPSSSLVDVGLVPDPDWLGIPSPNDTLIDPLASYQVALGGGIVNGQALKRVVSYAESQCTEPLLWVACGK